MTYRLFGASGWGSALAEAMLAACDIQPEIEDVDGFDHPGPARDRLVTVNPLAQVPTLQLPDGRIVTESAAIALLLSELYPGAELAPPPGDLERAFFLRYLIWLVANVYPTFTYSDYPERFVQAETELLARRGGEQRKRLWLDLEREIGPPGTLLAGRFSALDIYIAVMTHWRPRRAWFERHCPRLYAAALSCETHPVIGPVLARNFPAAPTEST